MSKRVLIITDGTESIKNIAQNITDELPDYSVKTCSAGQFEGTDLLPAEIFFIGCENPSPSSFSYLEKMLAHINLASRKCGCFSTNEKSLDYLCGIVKDCEASLADPLHIASENIDLNGLKSWVNMVI